MSSSVGQAAQAVQPLIRLDSVRKSFGSNTVLDDIDFALRPGEIHALCGENGAGKSTCLGLFYGLHQPNAGKIYRDGEEMRIESPSHAQALGIGCVFQELSLAGALSVAENIYAGRAPSRMGIVDWRELRRRAETLLSEFGLDIDVSRPVDSLPISSRQIIEIAKALSLNSRILLLDEPTSALAPDEVDALFHVLRGLTQKGIGIVYVSHHMSEIFRIADRVTVLRDGRRISTRPASETSQEQVVAEMIGSAHPGDVQRSGTASHREVLRLEALSQSGHFEDISFSVKAGEIVGLAGLMGARRSEIVRSIVGLMHGATGQVLLKGQPVRFPSLRDAMDAGVGFVPEERKTEGLFLDQSLSDNLVAASLSDHASFGIMRPESIRQASRSAIDAFSVKTRGVGERIGALSGGNQQKVMLAKWLKRAPDLLVVEEPTKGVDVGAKFQIHTELMRCAANGMAIIIVSSDFPELVSLSNRILVIHEGRLMGDVAAHDATEDALLQMAAGQRASIATPDPVHTGAAS
ncbi:MAG: sugar ABC transporter ATP-binding protein [Roseitalea sp.]|nr:sugar ABC transporter ATP-binding protein [Roseitalea sp.]MBO6951552.1 sugar ABC transporter ATP-binding protein [Rhizobiaceae bacterium]MBO6592602.1 sugar ABC transporter ATP-binding protein [Roseitalea sp.]MBO6598857.1 sugar ABC transporter ATP-binding protein [Roseitalea sp.]MBO6611303.1 sugar ABC transporter ATP-binding protein [Roseitalea sp.]